MKVKNLEDSSKQVNAEQKKISPQKMYFKVNYICIFETNIKFNTLIETSKRSVHPFMC